MASLALMATGILKQIKQMRSSAILSGIFSVGDRCTNAAYSQSIPTLRTEAIYVGHLRVREMFAIDIH